MLTNDSLKSADGPTEATTRRRLLHVAATVAATAPQAALTAGGAAQAAPETPATAPRRIRRAVLAPRFDGDAAPDWYPEALRQLAGLGITTKVVSLLPAPTAPGIDETVAAIGKAAGDNPQEIAQTILIGHSVGSRALLAYLSRHGAHRTFAGLVSVAGWFTVDDLKSYPALARWVNMDLNLRRSPRRPDRSTCTCRTMIRSRRTGGPMPPIDWAGSARRCTSHIAHGAGHYMTASAGSVLDTIRVASLANT